MKWTRCEDALPKLVDASCLVYFAETDSVEMVHIEDYFRDMTAGIDEDGNQLFAKWYISQGVTHWMQSPSPPKEATNG